MSSVPAQNTLLPPPRVWWRPLGADERLWLALALVWCLILFAGMWVWGAVGAQNNPTEAYRVEPARFEAAFQRFVAEHKVGDVGGVPVVEPVPGEPAFVKAMAFQFQPVLKLRRGQTYTLYVSSTDRQHGLSIQPVNLNFQILPGYIYVIRLTPREAGEFALLCNEYCGLGHHLMTGKIIVTD